MLGEPKTENRVDPASVVESTKLAAFPIFRWLMTIGVDELVSMAGAALEAEDRYVLGCSRITDKSGGILRILNERYYQFVVCRGWLSRWNTIPELRVHDAVILEDNKEAAIIEMKCWRSTSGETEIPRIKFDIEKLKAVSLPAFMILFSANESKQTKDNLEFLYERLPELKGCAMKIYGFPTINTLETQCDFWVAGWQLR